MKLISGYLWAFKNYEAGKKSLQTLKKFYSDADLFINVDFDGDLENYKKAAEEIDATFSVNNFQLGYCGNFGNINIGRDCWPKEHSFEWLRGLYDACKKTNSKYILLLEEDDFVLKPISIVDTEFSMAIHPTCPGPTGKYRPNFIPNEFLVYISNFGGNSISPGYAAGGGTIFNREHFIDSFDRCKDKFWKDYDYLKSINKIIGWQDFLLQFIMMMGGYEIIQNNGLCETWEVDDWTKFEIVTWLKDHSQIKI